MLLWLLPHLPRSRRQTIVSLSLSLSLAVLWLQPARVRSQTSSEGQDFTYTVTTAPLKLSPAAVDRALRQDIDRLPRRVNDQFQNLGDMVNFVVVGSQKSERPGSLGGGGHT
jgi:hypothetical protein